MGKCIHMRELSNRLILLITLLCVFFTGCTTAADIDTDDENAEKKYNYIYDKLTAQSSVSSRAAFGDDGYYFLANGILYYYDMSDADAVPVCSKAECSHKDEECDAYIYDNAEYDTYDLTNVNINCLGNMIWFEDGNLYMIKRDKSGDYLMQYDSTFKNERTVCTLAEKGTTVGGPTATTEDTAVLYNGYLYYFTVCPVYVNELVDKNYYITFYCNRVKVSQGAKPEVLGQFDAAMDASLFAKNSDCKVSVNNDKVLFTRGTVTRYLYKNNTVQYKLYTYDCQSSQFSKVLDIEGNDKENFFGEQTGTVVAVKNNICIDEDGNIYLATGDANILKVSEDGTTKVIYSSSQGKDITSLFYNEKHIFFYESQGEKGRLTAIDKEGKVEAKFEICLSDKFKGKVENFANNAISIYGIDKQNIVLKLNLDYILHMENDNTINKGVNKGINIDTYGVVILDKENYFKGEVTPDMIFLYNE